MNVKNAFQAAVVAIENAKEPADAERKAKIVARVRTDIAAYLATRKEKR